MVSPLRLLAYHLIFFKNEISSTEISTLEMFMMPLKSEQIFRNSTCVNDGSISEMYWKCIRLFVIVWWGVFCGLSERDFKWIEVIDFSNLVQKNGKFIQHQYEWISNYIGKVN